MIEEIITQFKGKTFSNHDEVVAWLKEKLTSFEKDVKEEAQEVIGVSKWREIGKKYKYWDYFEKEVEEEEDKRIWHLLDKYLRNNYLLDEKSYQDISKIIFGEII